MVIVNDTEHFFMCLTDIFISFEIIWPFFLIIIGCLGVAVSTFGFIM